MNKLNRLVYDDTEYTCGSRCLMCGTAKKPVCGRCVECSYIWVKSSRHFGNDNWHAYDELAYNQRYEYLEL